MIPSINIKSLANLAKINRYMFRCSARVGEIEVITLRVTLSDLRDNMGVS